MINGKKLAKRVSNIVDMTVEERSALLRVARAAKELEDSAMILHVSPMMGTCDKISPYYEFVQALKEVEHLL